MSNFPLLLPSPLWNGILFLQFSLSNKISHLSQFCNEQLHYTLYCYVISRGNGPCLCRSGIISIMMERGRNMTRRKKETSGIWTRAERGGIRRSTKTTNNAPRTDLSNADPRLKPRSVSFMAVLIRGCNLRPWRIYLAHISRHPSKYPCVSCRRELHDKTEIDGSGLEMFAGLLAIRKSIRRRRG